MEGWKMKPCHPSFHSSNLPIPQSVNSFLKHALIEQVLFKTLVKPEGTKCQDGSAEQNHRSHLTPER